jgi:hypothetical protein
MVCRSRMLPAPLEALMAIDYRVQQRVAFEFMQGRDFIAFERQRAVERRSSLRRAADVRVQVVVVCGSDAGGVG